MLRIDENSWHPVCTHSHNEKIGFPGWPEPILDSVTGFGASIEKEGACTSPLFHFQFNHSAYTIYPSKGRFSRYITIWF